MAANRESSAEESSEWAGISESGDDDMDFEVGTSTPLRSGVLVACGLGGNGDYWACRMWFTDGLANRPFLKL